MQTAQAKAPNPLASVTLGSGVVPVVEFNRLMADRAKHFADKTVKAGNLMMDNQGNIVQDTGNAQDRPTYPLQKHALMLLGARLGIGSYISKCPAEPEEIVTSDAKITASLRAINVNYWLKKRSHKELLMRLDAISGQPEIRAVLSKQYSPIGNDEVSRELTTVPGASDLSVRFEWTPMYLYAHIISDKCKMTTPNGEVIQGAIHLRNSEVGLSKIVLESMVMKEAAPTGAILREWSGFNKVHKMDRGDLFRAFRESVPQIFSNMSGALQKYADLQKIGVNDPNGLLETIGNERANMFNEDQKEAIKTACSQEGELKTMWNIVNVLTRAAGDQTLPPMDREKLMKSGGKIVYDIRNYGVWTRQQI